MFPHVSIYETKLAHVYDIAYIALKNWGNEMKINLPKWIICTKIIDMEK